MVQELVKLLPEDPGTSGLVIALTGSLIGVAIWLIGARFSRGILTLLTVLLGAAVGQNLPEWLGWTISGAGPAVVLALGFGLTGYALHGMWVGIGLGTVLSAWAALACWIGFKGDATWAWPAVEEGVTLGSYCSAIWQGLPPDVARVLPYGCATAMISGMAMAILWPRFSLLLGWSCAGATLLAGMGLAAVDYGQPEWLTQIPPETWIQTSVLGGLITLGMLIQWKLAPTPVVSKAAKKDSKDNDE